MGSFTSHMDIALDEARAAGLRGEVPVGAVVIAPGGQIVARAGNRTRELNDPTAHAEILALRAACAGAGSERLPGHDLYVTLEPCPMCAAAMSNARIERRARGSFPTRNAIMFPRSTTASAEKNPNGCCAASSRACARTERRSERNGRQHLGLDHRDARQA